MTYVRNDISYSNFERLLLSFGLVSQFFWEDSEGTPKFPPLFRQEHLDIYI